MDISVNLDKEGLVLWRSLRVRGRLGVDLEGSSCEVRVNVGFWLVVGVFVLVRGIFSVGVIFGYKEVG